MSWLFALLLFNATSAQLDNPNVSWTAKAKRTAPHTYTLTLKANIKAGWYVYSQHSESDQGPIPTAIVLEKDSPWTVEAPAEESGDAVRGHDPFFGVTITKYKRQLVIRQTLKRTTKAKTIKGYVTFMSCDNHRCLPPTDVSFEVRL